jgi:hypothetical protein
MKENGLHHRSPLAAAGLPPLMTYIAKNGSPIPAFAGTRAIYRKCLRSTYGNVNQLIWWQPPF